MARPGALGIGPASRGLLALVAVMVVLSGCGSHHASRSTPASSTTPVTAASVDHWKPPAVGGPPGTAKFCSLLVADYRHVKTNAVAKTTKVKQQIIGDFVQFTPTVIAAAPASIASAATLYLSDIAKVLGILNKVGLNAAKAPRGQVGNILFDPTVQSAGSKVFAFSTTECHFNLAGVG